MVDSQWSTVQSEKENVATKRQLCLPLYQEGIKGVCIMKLYYNPRLKQIARKLRKQSTYGEIKLWQYLKNKQLLGYDFHRQKPIGEYIVDFYCPKLKIAIEIDGYSHNFTFDNDINKEKFLNKLGIKVLRFLERDVLKNIEGVLEIIKENITTNKHLP